MNNKYIIVMNQFINGGVENLFLTIADKISFAEFYLIILNNERDEKQVKKLPKNVKIIDCRRKRKLFRLLFFTKYIRKELCNIKTMIDFHEILTSEFFMYFNRKYKDCVHWINSNPYMRMQRNRKDLYYKIFPFYKKVICICDGQKELLQRIIPNMNKEKLIVSYDFVDSEKMKELSIVKKESAYESIKYITMVARCTVGKDFVTLIKAYEKLPLSLQNEYKLLLIGDGPNFGYLEKIVLNSSSKDNIFLLGNRENPYPYIKDADVFVLSSCYEGFGLVVLEAMALGTPVIISNYLCSAEEITGNGEYGLLFDIGDVEMLSKLLEFMLLNDNVREKFSAKGIERERFYYEKGNSVLIECFKNNFYL